MNGALGSFATLGTKTTLGTVAPLTKPLSEVLGPTSYGCFLFHQIICQ